MDEPRKEELDPDELEAQNAEPLPDREAMSIVDPDVLYRLPPLDADPSTLPPEPGPESQ